MPLKRLDGRAAGQLRPLSFQRHWLPNVPGSVLVEAGGTRVLCTAIVEEGVPPFLINSDQGWLTAEYSMLPASTGERRGRDRAGKTDGRSVEIQRLVGRSLRAIVNRKAYPGRTAWVDCDVLSADGGTRTAAINGAYVALHDAFSALKAGGALRAWPLLDSVRAVSIGLIEGELAADLTYYEDSQAEVDMNLVMTGAGRLIEVSGGAERGTFTLAQLHALIEMGQEALARVGAAQEAALAR
ncbi:MAG TPA: ribonuclease PH [Planctomycetota bacterium]|nr:ribonuclease PH [Planctomycetota bacterium]